MAPVTVTNGPANEDQFVPDELVGLLHRASETMALSLISDLSPRERADLAMFCYRKAHLHRIGLIIAGTCDQDTLVQALGTNLGRILHDQACERPAEPPVAPVSNRSKITLAKFTPRPLADLVDAPEDDVGEPEPLCA
jgi:hypothetical protein